MKFQCFVVSLALCLRMSLAWWEVPHMLTAEVARQHLLNTGDDGSHALNIANELIAVLAPYYTESQTFDPAAVWADDLKSFGDYRFSAWHFIDHPYVQDGVTGQTPSPVNNIVWAMDRIHAQLSGKEDYPNTSPPLYRFTSIRFAIHFMGDLHEPLHCISRFNTQFPVGDRGGNSFILDDPVTSNLHKLWDDAGKAFPGVTRTDEDEIKTIAAGLLKDLPPSSFPQFVEGDCNYTRMSWESFDVAVAEAYPGIQYNQTIPPAYLANTQRIAKQQIVLGGLRLASCLTVMLKDTPDPDDHSHPGTVSLRTFSISIAVVATIAVVAIVFAIGIHMRTGAVLKQRRWGVTSGFTRALSLGSDDGGDAGADDGAKGISMPPDYGTSHK